MLPVRVLGKCGGYDSDIIAGMAWAAGFPVQGVPNNPYPARIINMSLGAAGSLPAELSGHRSTSSPAAGVLIVVSAGNEGGPVDAPANCAGRGRGRRPAPGRHQGRIQQPRARRSRSARRRATASTPAPGAPCLFSIETTTNTGTTVPGTTPTPTSTTSTSAPASPRRSSPGIAGLMLAVNGNLTASQLIERLQLGATARFRRRPHCRSATSPAVSRTCRPASAPAPPQCAAPAWPMHTARCCRRCARSLPSRCP